ncbi:hypothetical protein F0562_007162 [Nyssa sinensis]|uniref:Uncharacterized protein n=1 Tax=Nyssa sinensis TaxID=561372 RepID=A0A5J5A7H5_9ASTE|nr:hypothetical protein F0562_007162 [Nyssa sinensis]
MSGAQKCEPCGCWLGLMWGPRMCGTEARLAHGHVAGMSRLNWEAVGRKLVWCSQAAGVWLIEARVGPSAKCQSLTIPNTNRTGLKTVPYFASRVSSTKTTINCPNSLH